MDFVSLHHYMNPPPSPLRGVELLDMLPAPVERAIEGGRDGQCAADDGAHADEKAGEGPGAGFAVDDLHW